MAPGVPSRVEGNRIIRYFAAGTVLVKGDDNDLVSHSERLQSPQRRVNRTPLRPVSTRSRDEKAMFIVALTKIVDPVPEDGPLDTAGRGTGLVEGLGIDEFVPLLARSCDAVAQVDPGDARQACQLSILR